MILIFLLPILILACASSSPAILTMYSAYKLNKQGDNIQPWHTPFLIWNIYCSISSSNCCFLTCVQISQEAGKVVWYSHPLKNFPVKGFGIVNKADIKLSIKQMKLSCFLMVQRMLALRSLVPLPFLNSARTSGNSGFTYCWRLA